MKKIGLICMALVMALGSLGVGYAMWSKTLIIDGSVGTGDVNAEFTQAFTDDDEVTDDATKDGPNADPPLGYTGYADGDSIYPGLDPAECPGANPYRYTKNVANSVAAITAPLLTATLTLNNAYPSDRVLSRSE